MKRPLLVALMIVALAMPAAGAADGGRGREGHEARARIACAGGRAELRLKVEDDQSAIEIELRVDARRGVQTFRIVLLHERTLVFSGIRRTTREGSLRFRRTVADWPWPETITARIATTSGRTCSLEATI